MLPALLLFLSAFIANGSFETLPDHRKSCISDRIQIGSSSWQWKNDKIQFQKGSDWQNALEKFCGKQFSLCHIPDFRILSANMCKKLDVFKQLFDNKTADPILWLSRKKMVPLKSSSIKPTTSLGTNVKSSECYYEGSAYYIGLEVQVLEPKVQIVWKCEDIGKKINGNYEFYKIPKSVWMFKDEEGITRLVDRERCTEQKEKPHLCGETAIHEAGCSVNSIQKCSKATITVDRKHHSYVRKLVDGMAVFGSFRKMTYHHPSAPAPFHIDPNLYYFGYSNSTTSFKDTHGG